MWRRSPLFIFLQLLLFSCTVAWHPTYCSVRASPPLAPACFALPIVSLLALRNNRDEDAAQDYSVAVSDGNADNAAADTTGDKVVRYVEGLMENLSNILDKWILTGNPALVQRVDNVLELIEKHASDDEYVKRAERMIGRSGMPRHVPLKQPLLRDQTKILVQSNDRERRQEAEERKKWETARLSSSPSSASLSAVEKVRSVGYQGDERRSALSRRAGVNNKPDVFMGQVNAELDHKNMGKNKDAVKLREQQEQQSPKLIDNGQNPDTSTAALKVSSIVAQAGGSSLAFSGETLGIGGLDDVLLQIRRRIWIPLSVPPQLLNELGICPVRGLLLYGKPGCGKTLLAQKLGSILSPMRPVTVVSGPEVLDKFVGSSEKNLREVFDQPPDIYDKFRIGERDGGDAVARAALHVIIMDEFDAIARTRGGRGGRGDQGDAGVARDSVVNQLLAKMDGVDALVVPTLVIGLTNKRSLIEPALLRSGRFEVQLEVPPPKTVQQRISIFKVHTKHMHQAGRLLVRDAPNTLAAGQLAAGVSELPTYDELVESLAKSCEGFSGASIAAVCRAAASHALERAVETLSSQNQFVVNSLLADCVVRGDDFERAVEDVRRDIGESDWSVDADAQ